MPSPDELLRRASLRYFATLIHAQLPDAWTLLNQDMEWKGLLEEDMVWMWQQLSDDLLSSKIHENITPIQWLFITQNSPRYWRSFIRRACEHSVLQRKRRQQVRELHMLGPCFLRKSHSRGRLCPPQMGSLAVLYVDFLQEQSRRRGSHVQGKKHQQISRLRGLFGEPTCPACLKSFHTMSKMNAHVHLVIDAEPLLRV